LTKLPDDGYNLNEDFYNSKGDWMKMQEKVEEILDKIRPILVRDGGNVELVEVEDGTIKVKLVGACAGCPMSTMTLKNGIERILKQEIPEVKEVVAV
jgi:Fe-S cluster biogenesis protein NfuA